MWDHNCPRGTYCNTVWLGGLNRFDRLCQYVKIHGPVTRPPPVVTQPPVGKSITAHVWFSPLWGMSVWGESLHATPHELYHRENYCCCPWSSALTVDPLHVLLCLTHIMGYSLLPPITQTLVGKSILLPITQVPEGKSTTSPRPVTYVMSWPCSFCDYCPWHTCMLASAKISFTAPASEHSSLGSIYKLISTHNLVPCRSLRTSITVCRSLLECG